MKKVKKNKFDKIVCRLSEPQLGVYLDEKVHDKDNAYSVPGIFNCGGDYSVDEIKSAIVALIEKHPILKGRVLETEDFPFLVCDSFPEIEITGGDDYSNLVRPFDLGKCLTRFFIVDNDEGMFIVYDMHHMISDATSRTIINRDLGLALTGELDEDVDLGFVYASRDSFESQFRPDYDVAYGFFREMFADIDEVFSLLDDVDGCVGSVSLPIRGVRDDVFSFVQDKGVTVSSFLNAVFAYTYSRFVGGSKVYYNFTENGRHEDYSQDAVGMFVRTVPVLVDCGNKSVDDFLSGVSDLFLEAMNSSVYPFRLLASEFNLSNSVTFEYNYDLNDTVGIGDGIVFSDDADSVSDLLCVVNDLDDGFLVILNHLDKISQDTAERFVNVFKEVLVQFLDKKELGDISYVSNDDVLLLDSYNDTEYSFEYDDILFAFNDNLVEYEDNILVGYGEHCYSHGEGAFIANKISDKLVKWGVVKQDYVALFVGRSEWYLLASLGVLTCGVVYVPIETSYPDDRIILMLKDTGARVVIVDDNSEQRMDEIISDNGLDIGILNVSSILDGGVGSSTCLNVVDVDGDDVACVLYTSGTTGTPNGVLVSRRALNNFVSWYVSETNFTSADVYGMHCSYVFDMHAHALYSPVITGGSLYVVPEDIRLDLNALNDYFVEHGCTHTYITSQVGKLFAESGMDTSIKLLCFGGMKLGELDAPDSMGPFESYGPSENLAISTSIFANKRIDPSSIGYFISNVKGYVLDGERRRVPLGAVGELYLSGYQLTRGYLNNMDENNRVFFDNPFDDNEGYECIYKTGDLVRFLPDGSLGIVGRRDGQVKIRGNRVELGEVESVIRDMDIVEDVTVQTIDNEGNNELVAYVVLSDDLNGVDLLDCVHDFVCDRKPDYMVPSYVVGLDIIPLTVNGKVDKGALPEVDLDVLSVGYVAPSSETEKAIVDAFEKVFNHGKVGVYDDFVRLGGDSLSAIKLLTYLDGFNVSVGDVLSLRTPSAIASSVSNVSFDLDLYSLGSGCPLNESQLNVFLDIKANDKKDAYLIPLFMNISGEYSVEDIKSALGMMFDVHPVLGMCVSDDFDVPYLVKGSKPSIVVESDVCDDFIAEFIMKPFDLDDCLCRFLIVENGDVYALFAVFHHLIFDGFSSSVFECDLFEILEGNCPVVDDSFLRVSAFDKQISETNDFKDASLFFESMLGDVGDVGVLLDSVSSDGPGTYCIDLDINVQGFLNKSSINENILFTGAFAYVLSRFVGDEDVFFNIIDNGRDRFNNYNSVGMFVNTLPLLVNCKNRSISSFMDYMSDLIYNVMTYNYYPYRLLAKDFDINANIIFQFLPDWISKRDNDSNDAFNKVKDKIIGNMSDSISELDVEVIQNGENYSLNINYSDKYSKDFIEVFARSYKLILHDMIAVDNLSEIDYASSFDLELLDAYNDTEYVLEHEDVLDAFNENLYKYSDNMLVSYEDRYYTYSEGAFIANKIALRLKNLGVEVQDKVAFLVERSELYMFCVLGVLSIGAVYIPLDDKLPDEHIRFILDDTDVSVVIVSDDTYERAVALATDSIIFNISDILKEDINKLDKLPVVYGNLACVLYTSGTTGIPKGVKLTRKSILNLSEFYIRTYALSKDDVYALFASISFDVAIKGIFPSICSGAELCVVPNEIKLDMKDLNDYLLAHNVTHIEITTQLAKLFVSQIDVTSLKVMTTGGEKLGDGEFNVGYRFVDAYGPTEACVEVTAIDTKDKMDYSSIGFLLDNIKAYILDGEFRRVPLGAVGELYLAGYQIAEGYLNRDEETKHSFIPNVFDDNEEYSVMYRTGDMVRFLPDGSLGIVGRRDGQVKIRGNRVEMGEVESIIRKMDIVEDVTIQVVNNNDNNELVAYVVLSDNLENIKLLDSIRNYVSKHKPDYMVPSYVIRLDFIPLTINGKVDKNALPEIDFNLLRTDYIAPITENEKLIVNAFEKVLKQDKIGVYDDFVRLGGDSLTAIRLLNYLGDFNLTVANILSLKTPRLIAENLNKWDVDCDFYSLDGGCPLNESQLNVYLDIMANDKVDAYRLPLIMDISGEYDVDSIVSSLESMLDVHPILCMCVSDEGDVPYLVKGSKPFIDVVSGKVDEDFIAEFLSRSFDLYDCLCRFLIVENGENYRLFGVFHHIIFDALSTEVFKQDLRHIINGEIVELDDSFMHVSAFSNQITSSDEFNDASLFYESMFVDMDDVGVLLDSVLADGPGSYNIDLNIDVKSFLEKYGVSENVLFTSVFAYTLSRFVGKDEVFFNIVENGRDRFNNFDSIGMFVNTLPLLVSCKNQSISSFMDYMSDLIYNVMTYNYYPYRLLAKEYSINANIIFQFMPDWIYKMDNDSNYVFNEEKDKIVGDMADLISDLGVEVIQNGENYSLNIDYSDKYSRTFIEVFARSYKLILQDMINVKTLSGICYASNDDLILLDEINDTNHDLLYDDILDAFNENLGEYPDNDLVSFMGRSYSYGEGAFIADRLAKGLVDLGVKSQDRVAFLTEPCEHYMFCVLGILSCGGVYVPLDDKLPEERISFILDDADCRVLIVSNETYGRVQNLNINAYILNISNIINGEFGVLNHLPVVYGDLACILYTSGSTGVPKGVKITRKSVLNLSAFYADNYFFSKDSVYGLFASVGFDACYESIFASIYVGACLSVVPDDVKLDMFKLNDYFINHNITHTFMSTKVGMIFMEAIEDTSLKLLSVGGEKLGRFDYHRDYCLVDGFGPTEAFDFISSINFEDKIDPFSVGFLNYNTKIYVLDDELRRVPVGAVGELYIAGYQLADGYLNRDVETSQVFVDNPFDDGDYGVLYRSGDMVRILPDGSLGFVGRRDGQVKVRGNRVELSEVESVIREVNGVVDVTVQNIENGSNSELVAYVVSNEGSSVEEDIRAHILNNKPEFMVPSFIVFVDKVPLTVNGKVDKNALPDVDVDDLHVDYVAPQSNNERLIVDAFESVLNQKGLGLFDDFVRLGGDSIAAIRVISFLQKNGISCTARNILKYKTPYLIGQNIVEFDDGIVYGAVEGEIDLLPIQNYFFDKISKNDYSQHFILKAKENIDVNILQKSLEELFNIHDMLRAVYNYDDEGNPVQEILPLGSHICNINECSVVDFNKEFSNLFINSIGSLDICNKLVDVSLIHCGDEDYVLFVIHHLIVDGVSWNIILEDLTYIYDCLVEGNSVDLLRPYPYKYWVEDVKDLVYNISDKEKEHWVEINELLDDENIKGKENIFSFNVDFDFDSDNLLFLSEEECWALAIGRAYKKTYGADVIFNRESYGRDDSISNLNRTVGWFTSQYPVLVNLSAGNDVLSLVKDVYSIKNSFMGISNLGLNYESLIYITGDLEYKHCPVSFNFLSNEFLFENDLFVSVNDSNLEISMDQYDDCYGISFNILQKSDGGYLVSGSYAEDTFIGDKYYSFVNNILAELEFICAYDFDDGIVCCLSEPQMGVYLDEMVNDMGVAYSTATVYECDLDCSVEDIMDIVYSIIDKHPVLKGRILNDEDYVFLVCDSYPLVEVVHGGDVSSFIRPFDLEDCLARFYIIDTPSRKAVFFDIHHIISDATTISVMNEEFKKGFNGVLDNEVDLGFVRSSYDDFVVKFDSSYGPAHRFFVDMLSEVECLEGLVDDVDGSRGSVILPILGVRDKLEDFVYEKGISVGNVFYAVFAYCLSRFTGEDKVFVNVIEHGRHADYLADSVGMFVRTIPLVVDCKDSSVEDYVGYVSDLVLDAMENSVYSFRLLADEFGFSNSVCFEYNYDLNDVSSINEGIVFSDEGDSVSDLLCVVNDLDDGFLVSLSHLDIFSQDTAERFVKVFKEILVQFLDKEFLGDIDYISNEDVELLDGFNDTDHDLDYVDVLDAFNDNLSMSPGNLLVSCGDCSYSYGEGAFIADRLAQSLVDLGVSFQNNVAFLVERSELYMFCVLGVLSVGGVYVPLDDKLPDERIKFILEDTDCDIVIVSDETYDRVVGLVDDDDDDVVLLNISDIVSGEVGCLSSLSVVYADLACILYTSGSTGVPKGVKITRKSIINVCEDYIALYGLDECDVYGLFSSIGFDMSSFGICLVFCAGACLNVIPEDIRFNILKLNDYFIRHNVSHAFISTQVGKLFMEEVCETSLEVLIVAGEKLGDFISPDDYQLVDAYGPTEALFICSINNFDKLDSSSVGFVNFNVKVYVLDDELRRVPFGAVGELYVAGYQLANGYLNLDDENRNAFINNPYDNSEDFNRLYRTGDLVRFLSDGSLAIVGRRDSQVKIRGNRVELTEVESVIRSMNIVEDVTVQTLDNNGIKELIAYVVLSADLDNIELVDCVSNYVGEYKPNYMVPSYVVKLDSIPLNVNGKVDKSALPDVDVDSLSVGYVAPRSEIEEAIVDAFEKVFNREHIGVYDDFVGLGGNSLSAIKLLSYLDGFNISAGDVLSLRTPSAIASSVSNVAFDLNLYSLDGGCPLSEPQLNVYLDIKANDKEDAYLIPLLMNIPNKYGVEDIRSALDVMIDVHPVLGMCVSDDFDVPYLVKGSNISIIVKSDVNNDFINKFLTEPFDLYDCLSRFLIFEDEGGFVLYGVFHHIIFDAISEDVFKRDLLGILDGHVVGVDDSFLQASAFNQQISESNDYVKAEEFYDSMLVDVDDASELLDSVLSDGPGSILIDLDIDNGLFSSFLEGHNLSLNVFFTGVFAYTLSRFVGSEKVLFNIVENGRDRFGNYDSVGMFVNTLPLLVDCNNQEIGSFVEYVSSVVYGVMRYNFYPFRLLANKYDVKSDILFQFLPDWVIDTNLSNTVCGGEDDDLLDDLGGLNADLSVRIIQRGNDYFLSVVYSDKYSCDFIGRFVNSYKLILNDMLNVVMLGDISYLSCDDLVLFDEFNETEMDLDYGDVLDAFNANLVKYPDNKLVSYGDKSYSYGEGAFIADNIGKSLSELAVVSGDCVGFLVPRSELYMFSVLGILSCGGVFVPLDDDLPDDRLSFILEDSACKVVIVSNDTDERLSNLGYEGVVLNISNIVNCDNGSLSYLPVTYGDCACILYTSGSTGVSKGVKVTRKALVNVAAFYADTYGLSCDDVYGLYPSIGFDAGCESLFKAIYVGACLSVVPDDLRFDMLGLNNYFINQNVTHTMMTTQVGKLFRDLVHDTSLDYLFVGGEKLGEYESPKGYVLVDEYGPTETNNFICSVINCDKVHFSSVGHLNYNSKAYVLDDELRRVPLGAVGELYLSGYQLADGYLNRDDETSRAFVDNPFDDGDYDVLYRTGDMVRFLPDGTLGIVGRRDGQVKVRGNRVELGEVESVIRGIDFVDDVTVQTVDNDGNNELVVYVVVSGGVLEGNLREFVCDYVASCKPDYMVPSYVVRLDEIPLTVNGKVDKGALPDVDFDLLQVEYVAPRSETEIAIVSAFEIVFNQKGIGLNDDFVRLGGDSIMAIRLISLLEKDGVSCSVRDIFNDKTPYNIAKLIDNGEKDYGFVLAREGTTNQNMFLLPPAGGLALAYRKLIKDISFEGNIYTIDDYQYELSLDEIRQVDGPSLTFEKYWDAIKDIFQDGDILVGYSVGCLHTLLLCERLEKYKKVDKCVLIDGTLNFVNDVPISDEEISSAIKDIKEDYLPEINDVEKLLEVFISNLRWNLHQPKVNSHIIYLSTNNEFKDELNEIASDSEFINIDSTHEDIIDKDAYKIFKYLI